MENDTFLDEWKTFFIAELIENLWNNTIKLNILRYYTNYFNLKKL